MLISKINQCTFLSLHVWGYSDFLSLYFSSVHHGPTGHRIQSLRLVHFFLKLLAFFLFFMGFGRASANSSVTEYTSFSIRSGARCCTVPVGYVFEQTWKGLLSNPAAFLLC